MECHSGIKKDEIMNFAGKWIELKKTILCNVIQTQKDKTWTFYQIYN